MTATAERPGRSLWSLVGSTAAMKVLVMGLSGVLGIITSRLIIENFGIDAYAQYGLIAGFPALLPFADLGIAAIVINTVAGSSNVRTDPLVHRTLVTAMRVLMVAGLIIMTTALVLTLVGAWPTLLGNGLIAGGSVTAGICLAIFGLVLPLTIGQRVIVGLQRTTAQVASQAVVAPFMILAVLTVVALNAPAGSALAVFSYIGNALVSVICLVIVARSISPQLGRAFRDIFRVRSVRAVAILSWTWPMLVQMIALPIAMQTDRLLLSHLTTGPELAQYNLASQLFGIVMQTIAAAGIALWPVFAQARAASRVETPWKPTLVFLAGGLLLGGGLALAAPLLARIVSGGRIELPIPLLIAFTVFVALQAAKYPVGMYMTDKSGLVFQVAPIVLLVPLNLGISWALIGPFGAAGTVIGSAVAVALCQVVPNLFYVVGDLRRRRRLAESAPPATLTEDDIAVVPPAEDGAHDRI